MMLIELQSSDPDDRRSTSGFCGFLGSNPMSWHSKKQHTVSRSSTEAKYRSFANLTEEVTWLQALLTELQIPSLKQLVLWCDNLSMIMFSSNPIQHAITEHIELDLYL